MDKNLLIYGDNLEELDGIDAESVDLVYLDPPFSSNRAYNVFFTNQDGEEAQAQIEAFDDTWTWTPSTEDEYQRIVSGAVAARVGDTVESMRQLLGETNLMAYLVMMTPRLVELRRVLKPTGSLYLHCDPTASHYLRVILDAIFGPKCFRNEIIWRRTGSHAPRKSFGPLHDTLLFYSKEETGYWFNILRRPYTREHVARRYEKDDEGRLKFTTKGNILSGPGVTDGESGAEWRGFDPTTKGRHWAIPGYLTEQLPEDLQDAGVLDRLEALYERDLIEIEPGAAWPYPVKYLSEDDGIPVGDIWAYQPGTGQWDEHPGVLHGTSDGIDEDVAWLGPTDPERLGWQTQKPTGLLERIIESSCPPDGVVLDPFCGCGTTVAVAQELGRSWIGIDITYLAVDLMDTRLRDRFGEEVRDTYEIRGTPHDLGGANALFERNPFDFERWAVSLVNGQPNDKQVADKGSDGTVYFPLDSKRRGRITVSVKGGSDIKPAYVRELAGTVDTGKSVMGVLITLQDPTKGMVDAANTAGTYTWPMNGQTFPKVQIVTIAELLNGDGPDLPPAYRPYLKGERLIEQDGDQPGLF